jgi:hypothetical protein
VRCSKSRGVAGRSTEGHARRAPSSASTRSHVTPAFSAVPPTGTRRGFSRPGRSPAGTVRSVLNPDGGSWVMPLATATPGRDPGRVVEVAAPLAIPEACRRGISASRPVCFEPAKRHRSWRGVTGRLPA